jgi:hypothetical protein
MKIARYSVESDRDFRNRVVATVTREQFALVDFGDGTLCSEHAKRAGIVGDSATLQGWGTPTGVYSAGHPQCFACRQGGK